MTGEMTMVDADPQLVHQILDRARSDHEHRIALTDGNGSWSYGELWWASRRFARWLSENGVCPGDRLVVRAVSDRRVAAMMYACSLVGVIFVPVNPEMRPFHLMHVIADAEPVVVLGADCTTGTKSCGASITCTTVWESASREIEPLPNDPPSRRATAFLIYTSGSTAMPKAVVSGQEKVMFAASEVAAALRYRSDDIIFCRLPLAFDYGLYQLLLGCMAGAEVVLANAATDIRLISELRTRQPTVLPIVPTLAAMIIRLAGRQSATLSSVRLLTNTGEDLPPSTVEDLRRICPRAGVQLMYGTTECKRISILEVDADRTRPGSVGRALRGTTAWAVDPTGAAVVPGSPGEIVVAGPHGMDGYWRAPEQTARTFRIDSGTSMPVLHTGDLGYLDEDGYIYLHGRADYVFKQHGMRVSAIEVEAAARNIPGVQEAALVLPYDNRGSVLCVVSEIHTTEVLSLLRDRLEPAKMPSRCRSAQAFPLGPTGKIDREALRISLGE